MDAVVSCYKLSELFPQHEIYGLTQQLRRAAVSVPANIAEGRARKGSREFGHFLSISLGSLAELQTHLEIAERLDYVDPLSATNVREQLDEVGKMLSGLKRSLEERSLMASAPSH
jgi:four helix bundle protein